MGKRKGGTIRLTKDGKTLDAKGNFTYGLGKETREAIVGSDGVHGYKGTVTAPFIEGELTDSDELDLDELANTTDSTIVLVLANGKTFVLRSAWLTNEDGLTGSTEEGAIPVRFEGLSAELFV